MISMEQMALVLHDLGIEYNNILDHDKLSEHYIRLMMIEFEKVMLV